MDILRLNSQRLHLLCAAYIRPSCIVFSDYAHGLSSHNGAVTAPLDKAISVLKYNRNMYLLHPLGKVAADAYTYFLAKSVLTGVPAAFCA